MKYSEIKVGQTAKLSKKIDWTDVNAFSRLTGDTNPVHSGDDAIVHGMLVASFISTLVGTILPGNGSVWISHDIDFISPVSSDDTITVIGTVKAKNDDNAEVKLLVDVYNQNGVLCVASTSWVKVPR